MGELIEYQSIQRRSVRQHFQTSSPLKPPGPIKLKSHIETPKGAGTKVCSNGPGHMTKMAPRPYMVKT